MSSQGFVKVRGLGRLQRQLAMKGVTKGRQATAMRRALAEPGKRVLKTMKQQVPTETQEAYGIPDGLLKKSLGRRTRTYRSGGAVAAIVGPRNSPKFYVAEETKRGTRVGVATGVRFVPMTTAAHPVEKDTGFARRTYDNTKTGLAKEIQDNVIRELVAAIKGIK